MRSVSPHSRHLRGMPIAVGGLQLTTTMDKLMSDYNTVRDAALRARTRRHLEQPLYYSGKWWARRLAIVTRWAVQQSFNGQPGVLLDPFAGSGTTLGEALRLGHRAIGVDINPFAAAVIKEAFSDECVGLDTVYVAIVTEALADVSSYYGGPGGPAGYFWAYEVCCPICKTPTLLLKRTVLVQHAYPSRHPRAWLLCPHDRNVFEIEDVNKKNARCSCGEILPLEPIRVGLFTCHSCSATLYPGGGGYGPKNPPLPVLVAIERRGTTGDREFGMPTDKERKLAHSGDGLFVDLEAAPIPVGKSTIQVLNWGFEDWADLLHPRQRLLAIAITKRIAAVPDSHLRLQLALAFSPFFEYHCRLTSFKGLGTGSVRQAFSRPFLHPVSISYEINPIVGTDGERRSGDPRTWYDLRTKRSQTALRQLVSERGRRIRIGTTRQVLSGEADVAIVCGDSTKLKLPPDSIDTKIGRAHV